MGNIVFRKEVKLSRSTFLRKGSCKRTKKCFSFSNKEMYKARLQKKLLPKTFWVKFLKKNARRFFLSECEKIIV